MKQCKTLMVVGCIALSLSACLAPDDQEGLEPEDLIDDAEDKEAFDYANDPARVDPTFLFLVHQLPTKGGAELTPWPGDYWATSKDSINRKWDNGESPSTKWAAAFGRPDTEEKISQTNGVKAYALRKECTTNSDCSSLGDGSSCATSYDGTMKRCIPGWWGICHGWAPAAVVEPAATKPVTVPKADGSGNVTFYPGDLEALMSLVYTNVPTLFLSSRCNKNGPSTDGNGRLIDGECRDMNPGAWHVLTTNMLGLRKKSFVLDRTYDDEVWNQPMSSFRITNAVDDQVPEITKAEAAAKLGLSFSSTPLLTDSTLKKNDWVRASFAPAAGDYTVTMTGVGDADLYVKKGSEPTASSYDCRPSTSNSNEECSVKVAAGETIYVGVKGDSSESQVSVSYGKPGAGSYTYNTSAKRFFFVKQEFCYINESSPARSTHNPANYTNCENVEYILETDSNGKILGGEWVGASRTRHPDFAWWATSKPRSSQADGLITYKEVKALLDQAIEVVESFVNYVMLTDYDMKVRSDWKSKYVAISIAAGTKSMVVKMTGTGDAQLFVRRGSNPTTTKYDCKSDAVGSSVETCTLTNLIEGIYYVRARSRTPNTVISIVTTVTR